MHILKYFQVSVTQLGGKPGGTIVITKPGTPPVTPSSTVGSAAGKNVVATSGAIAQLIQAAPASHGIFHFFLGLIYIGRDGLGDRLGNGFQTQCLHCVIENF